METDILSAVLIHLRLSKDEWFSINEKRQDQLFNQALKEIKREQRKQTQKILKNENK